MCVDSILSRLFSSFGLDSCQCLFPNFFSYLLRALGDLLLISKKLLAKCFFFKSFFHLVLAFKLNYLTYEKSISKPFSIIRFLEVMMASKLTSVLASTSSGPPK